MAKAHSPETKAAVLAALLAGQGVNEVAIAYHLDKATVSRWKKTIPDGQLQQVATEKRERLVDLIEAHLTASLKGATVAAGQVHDGNWRARQSAENLAVFYGVLTDKSIRLLEIAGKVFSEERSAS